MSYETIASYLNERGITTDGGASWYPTTVRRACLSRRCGPVYSCLGRSIGDFHA
jgi:6-phosphogluconate dehydrogenase